MRSRLSTLLLNIRPLDTRQFTSAQRINQLEGLAVAIPWGFESPLPHHCGLRLGHSTTVGSEECPTEVAAVLIGACIAVRGRACLLRTGRKSTRIPEAATVRRAPAMHPLAHGVLHETGVGLMFRQVFTNDGPLPAVTEPTWILHRRMEGETFVTETAGRWFWCRHENDAGSRPVLGVDSSHTAPR